MTIFELLGIILITNGLTFGNGPVMVPLLQRTFVEERGVMTNDAFLYAFTVGRVTPGPANVYVASLGYLLFGLPGVLVTVLAIIAPALLMLPMMAGFERIREFRGVQDFTRGLTAASVGLIFAAVVGIARSSLTGNAPWAVFGLMILLAQVFRLNTPVALLLSCAAGVLLQGRI